MAVAGATLGLCLLLAGPALATRVVMETDLGDIEIELFDQQTPGTVANFLEYVNDGRYTDSFVHRVVPGFVVQGGGFTFAESDTTPVTIPADPPVGNEPGISNTRGTIAMARLSGQPNSATSQWFINVADNTSLDTVDGGFTVFGEVVAGMDVVDAINSLQIWNAGGSFAELPLIDYPGSGQILKSHLVTTQVSVVSQFVINAGLNDAWVSSGAPFQGMFITVFENLGLVFLAWFTFDPVIPSMGESATFGAADQRWVTALGAIDGNSAVLSAELTRGGRFNTSDPLPSQDSNYGTISLAFSGCNAGEVAFEFPAAGLSGVFDIQRVLDSGVALCELLQSAD